MIKSQFQPNYAIPPGETLSEVLESKNLKPAVFSQKSSIPILVLTGVLEGNEPITIDIANKFEYHLDTPASFWINLESNYRNLLDNNISKKWTE